MFKKLSAGFVATIIGLSTVSPAFADSRFTDDSKISDWSSDHIEILKSLGVIVGYPDGTFRPHEDITREEMAVMLLQSMIVVEESLRASMLANDVYLYEQLVAQQTQLLQALVAIDELQAEHALNSNDFIALSVFYNPENDTVDDNAYISLDGKYELLNLTDSLTISIRPFVNTTGEAGGAVTVDYPLTDKLTIAGGAGALGSWSDNSALAGDSEVIGYGQANLDYNLSHNTVVTLGAKVPFTGDNSGDVNVGLGIGFSF